MEQLSGRRRARFELVTAAHEFLLTALPLRHPSSRQALARFLDKAATCSVPVADADAVLLDVLSVLHPHAGGRLPSLVDRYLAQRRHFLHPLARFRECVEDLIAYRGIGNRDVQRAVAIVEDRYTDPRLTQAAVADEVGLLPDELSMRFRRHMSLTFTEYLRDVRLDRAATLLATTERRIKEIWVEVGYNDASNFDHQFKARFGSAPREFRIRSMAREPAFAWPESTVCPATQSASVLIVEDNQSSAAVLAQHLRSRSHRVAIAATGHDGLLQAQRQAVDVVVLDYNLPDIDGLQWLRAMRALTFAKPPSVLLFTADWDVADEADEIHTLGALFASKLCDIDELDRLIASLISMQRHLAENTSAIPSTTN